MVFFPRCLTDKYIVPIKCEFALSTKKVLNKIMKHTTEMVQQLMFFFKYVSS